MDGSRFTNHWGIVCALILAVAAVLSVAAGPAYAQEQSQQKPAAKEQQLRPPSVTKQSIRIGGETINYTATVGYMEIADDKETVLGHMFYTAYVKDGENTSNRPLTFCFNGGPGSSSFYLHMLTIGPRRAMLADDGNTLAPPPRMEVNEQTWLTFTDLVFIDPIATGFSRSVPDLKENKFFGVDGDADSVAEFVRMYITANDRWLSPVFVAGESYGGIRGALLANVLQNKYNINLNLNGLIYISPAFDMQFVFTRDFDTLSLALYMPTYATTAWFHKKLAPELQADFDALVSQAQNWAMNDYLKALIKGDSLGEDEMRSVAEQMARYTGLAVKFIMEHKLRITSGEFREELLRDDRISLDRLDARFPTGSYNLSTTLAPLINHYLRQELGYDTLKPYSVSAGGSSFGRWDWGGMPFAFSVVPILSSVMQHNPHMKVFVSTGYYDFAVPFSVIEYCLDQLLLEPDVRKNITLHCYRAGHMVYTPRDELSRFTEDVRHFIEEATKK